MDILDEDMDGSIISIHVCNFLCHENLEINLNRNVNFIVGRNGSGKSTILNALVVGLGGKASATNRGHNSQAFIKNGANSATIEIKIKNSGAHAYKHNVYGDYITVVRKIYTSGASSYKVKSATGEVISTKFEDVNAIVLAHDIQVKNPISVLNQSTVRTFHTSEPAEKYSLFRQATNLDQTEANYDKAIENCNKATLIWDKKNNACAELEKEYQKWNTSYEQLKSRDEIEAQKQALQNEYYWSEVADLEKEANKIQAQYAEQKAEIEMLVEKLKQMKKHYGGNSEVLDALRNDLDNKTLEKTAQQQELYDLENEVRKVQATWRSAQQSAGKQQVLLNRELKKVADLEQEIQNIDSGSAESRRGAAKAAAEGAAQAAAEVRARSDTAHHDAAQARAHAHRAHAAAAQLQARAATHRDTLKKMRQQLRELESRGNDSLAVYGNDMVVLCQEVKKAVARGEFSTPPRGPIGAYLEVKDKKWGRALEHIIGGSIRSFCVNTAEDSRKLFEIMARVYGRSSKPAVTCSKFLNKVHDVNRNTVRAGGCLSALQALQVQDPVVANYLIDNLGLEAVLLVPGHDDAIRLADREENVPENCSRIVTLDATDYYPAPNYRSYGSKQQDGRYLQVSTAERKRQLQEEIGEAEAALGTLEAEAEAASEEARGARESERETSRALQALQAELHRREKAARLAAAALDHHQAPHHAVLVEELNLTKEKLRTIQEQVDAYSVQEEEYRRQVDEYDVRMKEAKKKLAELTATCRTLTEEIDQEQIKMDQGLTQRKTYQQRVKEDRVKLTQKEAILEEKRAIIDTKVAEALQLCPRMDRPRDLAIVTGELKKTQLKLRSLRGDGLGAAQVAERLLRVERRFRRTHAALQRLKRLIHDIKSTTVDHLKTCHNVQKSIVRRVQFCFQTMLTVRGYSGSIEINPGKRELEIKSTGRERGGGGRGGKGAKGDKGGAASTSSLSGGERSYCTVAFIMALWDCVELPFYFMDEFDLFMDEVNRRIVVNLLIDHALKNTSRQFVFLTPNDVSTVTAGPQISIHLLAAPRP